MHSTSNTNGMCTVARHRSVLGFAQIKSEVYDRFKSYVICRHAGYVPLILGGRLGSSEFVHKGWGESVRRHFPHRGSNEEVRSLIHIK